MKYFIITIDTEGDNLWSWRPKQEICTENARYLQRFQSLCHKYAFKPVWLTNYEMICNPVYERFIRTVIEANAGEIGMHLHAWNTPPDYELPVANQEASYLIEYPLPIMEEKIACMTETIEKRVGIHPVSHRAGRWAMNRDYFNLLAKYGYRVDCSFTPHIDWSGRSGMSAGSAGSDYTKVPENPHDIETENGRILEVPVTVRKSHHVFPAHRTGIRGQAAAWCHALRGQNIWCRPNGHNLHEITHLVRRVLKSGDDYVMFMLHSSELMPGGSPTFRTEADVETLYTHLAQLFQTMAQTCRGITLKEYCDLYRTRTDKKGYHHE